MAYNELIKNFERIREYMRDFYVYGFKTREEYHIKSARSYDNERRRIESWLSEYMSFRRDQSGKNVFITMDSREIPKNPFYKVWKAKSFTKNDITLHFWLSDILSNGEEMGISEIIEIMSAEYQPYFDSDDMFDESTLRKKLAEYVNWGLIKSRKHGKQVLYTLVEDSINLDSWALAVAFFSETDPMGVIGSFVLDKLPSKPQVFNFKHSYMLFALDSEIMLGLLILINERRRVVVKIAGGGNTVSDEIIPLKIYISVSGGRQYVLGYSIKHKMITHHRLDRIKSITAKEIEVEYDKYLALFETYSTKLWGVSTRKENRTEHLEIVVSAESDEKHIVLRLIREKRSASLSQINDTLWKISIDVYDPVELLPWIRTFTGRIVSLYCSDQTLTAQFQKDLAQMCDIYGGE